jgi:L-rhamnose mutarotase
MELSSQIQPVTFIGIPAKSALIEWPSSSDMIRKAFVMSVHSGAEVEYVRRHQPIWPELQKTLLDHGVRTYSIFLQPETRQLFAYVEFANQEQWESIAQTEVCKRWWAHMRELMPSNPDNSPVSEELREIFHIPWTEFPPDAIFVGSAVKGYPKMAENGGNWRNMAGNVGENRGIGLTDILIVKQSSVSRQRSNEKNENFETKWDGFGRFVGFVSFSFQGPHWEELTEWTWISHFSHLVAKLDRFFTFLPGGVGKVFW